MNSKNDPTTFLPLESKIGGPVRYVKDREIFVKPQINLSIFIRR